MVTKVKLTDKALSVVHVHDSNDEPVEFTMKKSTPVSEDFREAWREAGKLIPHVLGYDYIEQQKNTHKMTGTQAVAWNHLSKFYEEMISGIERHFLLREVTFKYSAKEGKSVIFAGDMTVAGLGISFKSDEIFYDMAVFGYEMMVEEIFDNIQKAAAKEVSNVREEWVQTSLFEESEGTVLRMRTA